MNKKLYSILFFVPLIVSLLAMTVVTGCSDDATIHLWICAV